MEMCFKNIYCENIYHKNTQRKNESVIVYVRDKMCLMHANIMAYQMPLVNVGEHPGHGLLVLLSLFLGGDRRNRLCWRTAHLLPCRCADSFLCSLLCLPGFMARFGAPMHFAVHGACFTMLHLGLSTNCNVPSHLLCGGRRKDQTLPTGKTAPVMANYDVVKQSDVILNDVCANGAAVHAIPYSHLCLSSCVDHNS